MSGNGTAETSEKTNGSGAAAPADAACSAVLNMTVNKGFRISRNPMRNQRAESGERALDKALAEFRPGQRREEKMRHATRRRRLSREGRTEKHRERSRRLRGKKSTSAPHQKYDPNPSEINHLRMKICFILKDSPEDSFHLHPAAPPLCLIASTPGRTKDVTAAAVPDPHSGGKSLRGKSAVHDSGTRPLEVVIFLVSPRRHQNDEEEPREFG